MEIKFQVFDNENLLIQKFTGVFSVELYMRYNSYLLSSIQVNSINKVLIDFRELKFDGDHKAFQKNISVITEIRKNILAKETNSANVIHVFWVNNPLPTAIAQLFKSRFPHLNYNTCSTTEHVLANFNFKNKKIDLDTMIANLNQTFTLNQ